MSESSVPSQRTPVEATAQGAAPVASENEAESTPGAKPKRKNRGWLYLVGMVGFFAFMWVTSQWGNTNTMWGFQRRVNIRLQQIERGINYDNRAEGVIVAKGKGVFQFLDLHEIFKRFQQGGMTIDEAAAEVATDVTKAREFAESLGTWEEVKPNLVAMPIARAQIHPILQPDEAASEYIITRGPHDLPFYTFFCDQQSPPIILLREHLSFINNAPNVQEITKIALANSRQFKILDEPSASVEALQEMLGRDDISLLALEVNSPWLPATVLLSVPDFPNSLRKHFNSRLGENIDKSENKESLYFIYEWPTGRQLTTNPIADMLGISIKEISKKRNTTAVIWTPAAERAYQYRFLWDSNSVTPRIFHNLIGPEIGSLATGYLKWAYLDKYYRDPNS